MVPTAIAIRVSTLLRLEACNRGFVFSSEPVLTILLVLPCMVATATPRSMVLKVPSPLIVRTVSLTRLPNVRNRLSLIIRRQLVTLPSRALASPSRLLVSNCRSLLIGLNLIEVRPSETVRLLTRNTLLFALLLSALLGTSLSELVKHGVRPDELENELSNKVSAPSLVGTTFWHLLL